MRDNLSRVGSALGPRAAGSADGLLQVLDRPLRVLGFQQGPAEAEAALVGAGVEADGLAEMPHRPPEVPLPLQGDAEVPVAPGGVGPEADALAEVFERRPQIPFVLQEDAEVEVGLPVVGVDADFAWNGAPSTSQLTAPQRVHATTMADACQRVER